MIRYTLRCAAEHEFEGWFRDSVAFEAQAGQGLVSCPQCGGTRVDRALMTPALGRKVDAQPPATPPPSAAQAAPAVPDALRAVLQRLRAEVERSSEHVGPAFAEQALAMHRGEIDRRAIHGDATPREHEMLEDEGVAVALIPWIARADG